MVKFVGGPSVGGYKSYINHTTAREGQWRMPRAYTRPKVDIKIKNYHYCNHGAVNTGYQLPAWLQWAQGIMGLVQGFIPATKEAPAQPEVNPLQAKVDELEAKIKELEQGKDPKKTEADPKVNEPATTVTTVEDKFDVSADAEAVTDTKKEEITTTTEAVVNKGRKRADGKVEYQGWKTLTASYGAPNTKEFRNWFRQEYLNGKDIWEIGTQNFPTEIEYPKGSGTIYKFNGDTFAKPIDLHDNSGNGSVSTADMAKRTKTNESSTTTYKGSAKATWTDENGKTQTATYTTPQGTTYKGPKEAKNAALAGIREKVPEQYRSNAKFQVGAREN